MKARPIALLPCRICLFLAGCFVPSANREAWRQEWLAELWYRWQALRSRGEWTARSALPLYWSALGCFRDACCQAAFDDDRLTRLRAAVRSPVFCMALLGAALLCLALGSGNFPATRSILSELPYRYGSRVALVSRTGRLEAIRGGIPSALAGSWLRDSKLLEAMATCAFTSPEITRIAEHTLKAASLQVSGNLLEVIGQPVSLGAGRSIDEPAAWLSFAFWSRDLHADPQIVGRKLWRQNRGWRIAGVLPPEFWFLSRSVQIYVVDSGSVREQSLLVVRSKAGASAAQLEAELSKIADGNDTPFTRTAPHVVFLADAQQTPLRLFGSGLLLAVILAGLARNSRLHRADRAQSHLPGGNWKWWLFLFAKFGMALLLVLTTGLETLVGLTRQWTTEPLGGPVLLWFYTAGCSAVLFAVIADQQARCRVCLRHLAFPIRIGCPGCLFLDWSGTELLCPEGHGVLYVPHHISCWDEAERWVALEI